MQDETPNNKKAKKHYVLKSISSRPTFPQDMTEEERNIMGQHIAYWTDKLNQGVVLVFGPVLDPDGTYGLGIMEVEHEEDVLSFLKDDPAVKAGVLRTDFYPMKAVVPE